MCYMTLPIELLRKEVERRGTQSAVSKWLGVSRAHVSDMLAGKRSPGPKVLKKLGLKKESRTVTTHTYRKAS